jgi:CDP-glucose 4,6-dehydratase
MAAQPLVRESYRDPRFTFETNVNGTLNMLQAVQATDSVQAHLVVTTDKVYRNIGKAEGYSEDEPLGGADPYSASKAMADLLVQSWTTSFVGPPTAIARAGNVIGGGDVSIDRLMPDLIGAFSQGRSAIVRNPDSVRPWQHVLDCLHGYLLLIDALLVKDGKGAWNFGPEPSSLMSVASVAAMAASAWGEGAAWQPQKVDSVHEAAILTLDSTKSRSQLSWRDRLTLTEGVDWTVQWEKDVLSQADPYDVTLAQIRRFLG